MAVYTRPDSKFYWLWLEGLRQKERTDIPVARQADAATQKKMRQAAERLYAKRQLAVHRQFERQRQEALKEPWTYTTLRTEEEAELLRLFRECPANGRRRLMELVANFVAAPSGGGDASGSPEAPAGKRAR